MIAFKLLFLLKSFDFISFLCWIYFPFFFKYELDIYLSLLKIIFLFLKFHVMLLILNKE